MVCHPFSTGKIGADSDNYRPNNATIEVIIEDGNKNNSLAGALNCPNSWPKGTGNEATGTWTVKYLEKGRLSPREQIL
jgi:hypothetical protein